MSVPNTRPHPITRDEIFAAHEGGRLSVAADPAVANTHTWAGRLYEDVVPGLPLAGGAGAG
jgi:hypothetical protein